VVGFYALVWHFYATYDGDRAGNGSETSPAAAQRDFLALCVGAAAAFGCSIKIYYLAPAIGFCFGMFIAALSGFLPWHSLGRYYARVAAGFVVIGVFIVFLIIGPHAFASWVGWNWSMLTHVDRYGAGREGVASTALMIKAFSDLAIGSGMRFPAILLLFALVFLGTLGMRISDRDWRRRHLPFCATVSLGLLINLLGLLKHYSPLSQHYALPVCATLPCLLPLLNRRTMSVWIARAGAVLAVVAMAANVASYTTLHIAKEKLAIALKNDEARIEALPLAPGKKRIWGYFSATRGGVLPMIDNYAASPFVHDALVGKSMRDADPTSDRDSSDWQYIVFPKTYYSSPAAIAHDYPNMFDFHVTNFHLQRSDKFSEYDEFFVLTRK
jgi:hypothetical protein